MENVSSETKILGSFVRNPPPGKETNTDGPSSCSPKQRKRLGGGRDNKIGEWKDKEKGKAQLAHAKEREREG